MFREEKCIAVVTLKLYGDESADETKRRVFAVAGVIGTEDEWQLAIREWLRRTRGMPFHATTCESEYAKHPDPQKHKDNLQLYEDLTKILAGSYLVGFAVALDLCAFRELFPNVVPDLPYYKCFSDVVGAAAVTAHRFNQCPEQPDDARLEFTFDSRIESDGTAGTLYSMLRNQPEWAGTGIFDTKVVFEGGQEPRLEMADLLARESMKELDRNLTKARRRIRASRRALEETGKFRFLELDRAYCERWKARIEQPDALAMRDGYFRWLGDTGRVQNGRPHDNMSNRILYAAWLDNKDALLRKRSARADV